MKFLAVLSLLAVGVLAGPPAPPAHLPGPPAPPVADPYHHAPSPPPHPCPSTLQRKEWRHLSKPEKISYIEAVKCMHKLPAESKLMGGKTRTRFDDFLALHISLTDEIHGVGQFLPWHRRYLQVYEQTLREKCGYKGAQPYWDQSLDVNNFPASPVFDPVFGFGGNGIEVPGSSGPWNNLSFVGGFTGGGCVTDGPFAHFNLSVGPGTTATNHCLTRGFNTVALNFIGPDEVALMYNDTSFATFRKDLEGTPSADSFRIHDGGHLAVAGEMCDRYSSPADPLFFLHHANLDRHWWQWQKLDLAHRLTDISGQSSVDPPFKNVTLDYQLKMDVLAPLVPIRNVMDVRSLCYKYV